MKIETEEQNEDALERIGVMMSTEMLEGSAERKEYDELVAAVVAFEEIAYPL